MFKKLPFLVVPGLSALAVLLFAAESSMDQQRKQAQQLLRGGNYREAYERYRELVLDPQTSGDRAGDDLERAVDCLQRLGRVDEIDTLRNAAIEAHRGDRRFLWAAARTFMEGPHHGYLVAGEFYRGDKRGGQGDYVSSFDRDRVQALRLMEKAQSALRPEAAYSASEFYLDFARFLLAGRDGDSAWQLQDLTDLSILPDYEESPHLVIWGRSRNHDRGAPVDADGNPIFHQLPESYQAATTDGQRWRWMLYRASEAIPARTNEVRMIFGDFLRDQFGVQTMRSYELLFGPQEGGGFGPQEGGGAHGTGETGPFAVHALADNETIAKLATGAKRFTLPDEFNFIQIYRQIAEDGRSPRGEQALGKLADIFEDRRQYPKAAEAWRQSIEQYGPGDENSKTQRLEQIVGNWGRFESGTVQPAGTGATIDFRFRNSRQVTLEAWPIKTEQLLEDVKNYLKSNPERLDWRHLNVENVGRRLVEENQTQYLNPRVAQWTVDLEPRKNHFDRRITITTPLKDSGAYLVTATMAGGNVSRIIIWLSDTVIVKKPLDGRSWYFVADAVTGEPVPQAEISFFGYDHRRAQRNRYEIFTLEFQVHTDANGQVAPERQRLLPEYQWIATARTKDGRFAFLGFDRVWHARRHDERYDETKVFVITDRPVYRPDQTVKFKFWIRNARYDGNQDVLFANRPVTIRISNPRGDAVFEQQFTTDAWGGLDGEFHLPGDAQLGQYAIGIEHDKTVLREGHRKIRIAGGGRFRVEEYKKPEFEVTVEAPAEPVMLGEKITATINARYYFGAPVTQATVKYKVLRTTETKRWHPAGRWDWLYGRGYGWFGADYAWYPGWERWGCIGPIPPWWPTPSDPPEVVLENEVPIGPDGTVQVEIDTALAKELHGDADHRYEITAEVVDRSRRTIVGKGSILAAREPFQVVAWVDRGWYRTGDTVTASFKAQTPDEKPVAGKGKLTLYRVTYDEQAKPIETAVETWNLDTNARGEAELQITAAQPGQYRLSYEVTDSQGHSREGGYVFVVRGEGFDGRGFRFNDLEIIPDKSEYQPGETVRLMINTEQAGSTVLLFVRPVNGVYLPPKVVRLDGKSTVHEIAVVQDDMPNFFIEAVTVTGGDVAVQTREIAVPPEQRVVNVDVLPSADEYRPGEEAKVRLKLTDLEGKPFAGSLVVSMYDKSVEYISGGSNVPEIKSFFWKWRRHHHPQTDSTLERTFHNLLRSGETPMGNLGVFGDLILERLMMGGGGFGGGAVMRKSMFESNLAMEMAAPMAAPAAAMDFADAGASGDSAGGEETYVQPTVRKEFADTAFWAGSLTSGEDGLAEISLTMPDNLTTWRIRTWAMGDGTRVGEGDASVITTKNLLVRLQAPRFFVETDEVVLSANVHNYLETDKQARVVLELEGGTLEPLDSLAREITIAADGEERVDWRVRVTQPGEAVVRMKALTDEESDAVEMTFPVHVHGMLKTESFTGTVRRDEDSAAIEIEVPAERRVEETWLEIRYSPTLAGAMVDALPYLADYPYGCTEQTLNRFLPTVITQNVLKRMNLDLDAVRLKRTNLNSQELGNDVARAGQWQQGDRNPVFDEAEVDRMAAEGLKALTEMQLSDGGWGWFSGYGEHSYPHTTALVVHGLQLARENGTELPGGVFDRGVAWLRTYQAEQVERLKNAKSKTRPYKTYADNLDAFVFMVLVDAGIVDEAMCDFLYRDRTELSVYAMGMFGLALSNLNDQDRLATIVRNIDQYLQQDDENQTAWLQLPGSSWWYWYGSEIEANAYYLKLLARTDPHGEKAARLVKYLLNNRKHATYWDSTRDTAICIEALAEYLEASGEDQPDMTLDVYVDGLRRKTVHINGDNLFSFDNRFVLAGDDLTSGRHTIELRREGRGPVYFSAYLTNFTLEDFITRAGLEVKVDRKYYKLVPRDAQAPVAGSRGQVVDQKVEKYDRVELSNLDSLQSGDLVEIELVIDSKNDYEYMMFEDMKPAGFEPVSVQSGYHGNGLGAYMELRDDRVTFFTRTLPRGKHSLSYRMRAETPGRFSALPTRAEAMYAPELRGNSDEIKLIVED